MPSLSTRHMFLLPFVGCCLIIMIALYMQYVLGQEPCPLCYVQRAEVMLFGVVALLGTLHNPRAVGRRIYAGLMALIAAAGIATAGRQIWLQHQPKDELPECLPPLEFMLEAFPLKDVITKMLYGSSDCAERGWSLFGLNIAEMSMISFVLMLLWSLWLLLRKGAQ